jgi:hypothetical protein
MIHSSGELLVQGSGGFKLDAEEWAAQVPVEDSLTVSSSIYVVSAG